MGGNALKEFGARRVTKDEYYDFVIRVQGLFLDNRIFGFETIPAIEEKDSFGDMDILVEDKYREDVITLIESLGYPCKLPKGKGNVISFLFDNTLQVDVVLTAKEDMDFSIHYFAFNDLGNLMGRIAHKMGLKYGHDGLWYPVRDGDKLLGNVCLTKVPRLAFECIGYPYETFCEGFETFEQMFKYVTNHPRFSPRIFDLANRNHTARVRDRKRATYTAFLSWCDKHRLLLLDYNWKEKSHYANEIFSLFPEGHREVKRLFEENARHELARSKFSATDISSISGLSGKDLGGFVKTLRTEKPEWDEFILETPLRELQEWVLSSFEKYQEKK